jgi:hypothetical protein
LHRELRKTCNFQDFFLEKKIEETKSKPRFIPREVGGGLEGPPPTLSVWVDTSSHTTLSNVAKRTLCFQDLVPIMKSNLETKREPMRRQTNVVVANLS